MLVKSEIERKAKDFYDKQNKEPKDYEDGAKELAKFIESIIYESIKNVQITIPAGYIVVVTANGPASNAAPIIINKANCIIK